MYRIDNKFLEESQKIILDGVNRNFHFDCIASKVLMDRVIVDFTKGGLRNTIASDYINEERFNFFLKRWRSVAKFLFRMKYIEPVLEGSIDLWLDDISTEPGLVFNANENRKNQIPVPDTSFLESNGYDYIRNIALSGKILPWKERKGLVFWRGATTGLRENGHEGIFSLPRIRLCHHISSGDYSNLFDVGITNIVQINDSSEIAEIKKYGFLRERVSQEHFAEYKYGIDIDGNANSWPGLFTKLLLGVTVLKVKSPGGFYQWYYNRLFPWVHYVPVSSDLSDLIEKTVWLNEHPDEAESIARNGQNLAFSMNVETELHASANAVKSALQGAGFHKKEVRPEIIKKLWRGNDPFDGFPTDRYALDTQGWGSEHHYLVEAMDMIRPHIVVEVGVWKGGSSLTMARRMKDLGLDSVVISIDTWLGSWEHWQNDEWFGMLGMEHGRAALMGIFMNNAIQLGLKDYIIPLPLDSLNAVRVLRHFNIYPDVVHIDGGHDYDAVYADLRVWWDMVNPGGLLIGDDYDPAGGWPDVKRAFDDFFGALGLAPFEFGGGKCRIRKPPADAPI